MIEIKDDFEPLPTAMDLQVDEFLRRMLLAAQECACAFVTLGEQTAASARAIEQAFGPDLLEALRQLERAGQYRGEGTASADLSCTLGR
jgi:hypothetical protein